MSIAQLVTGCCDTFPVTGYPRELRASNTEKQKAAGCLTFRYPGMKNPRAPKIRNLILDSKVVPVGQPEDVFEDTLGSSKGLGWVCSYWEL